MSEPLTFYSSRRDFLRMAGFTIAGAALSSCARAPVQKAIPYLVQPEAIVPGRSSFYTSSCDACSAGCGIVMKSVDGRPIKLEGNPRHPLSRGALCAVGQASILGLYDSMRFDRPMRDGKPVSWADIDREILEELNGVKASGRGVRVLSSTIVSPTLRAAIATFVKQFPDGRHVTYDALSSSAMLDAYERTHGVRALPRIRFERAEVIVGIDADFLGTWLSPVEFAQAYRDGRQLESNPPRFSYHAQFESRMSVTGMKADRRVRVAPRDVGPVLTAIAARLGKRAGSAVQETGGVPETAFIDELTDRLWQARGRSVVVCGTQDVQIQTLCNYVNQLLGSYGATLDFARPSRQAQGNDRDLENLLAELRAGKVGALFIYGANPAYELPSADAFRTALQRVPLVVSLAQRPDETTKLVRYVCPDAHPLESWGDAEPVDGMHAVRQPGIQALGETRPAIESFSAWSGATRPAYDLIREHWQANVFPRQARSKDFEEFWRQALWDGFVEADVPAAATKPFDLTVVRPVAAPAAQSDALTLVLYPKPGLRDGRHSYNAWLQELPDPVTKVTWDNYACLSVATATRLGVRTGDVVRLDVDAGSAPPLPEGERAGVRGIELPALVQPGQHDSVVAVALGYGSALSARFDAVAPKWLQGGRTVGEDGLVGKNVAQLLQLSNGVLSNSGRTARVTKTDRSHVLASTQEHFSLEMPARLQAELAERPPVVRQAAFAEFQKDPSAGNEHHEANNSGLWPDDHQYPGHRWGMVIDLTACTGCSACVMACQAENNVPVVGKDEVNRSREMHWIRLDRYYTGTADDVDASTQPMLCQHCENAPCETVCPVLATVHDSEGLNVQVYNRCVGTRFCANNCPYKVRRFNWFDYVRNDPIENLALSPDVAVRSRGVMEKCSFCHQRIQETKLEAERLGQPVADGTLQTACQQTCPSRAIVFGDMNDPNSRVSQLRKSGRYYRVLEELNTRPSVGYLTSVRNRQDT